MIKLPGLLLLAVALQLCAVGGVVAATPAATASSADDAHPQSTTATYGDWTLRCIVPQAAAAAANAAPAAPQQQCEVDQAIQIKGQAGPVAQIALGNDPASGNARLVVQVPVGVWLPTPVKLQVGANAPLALAFKRCLPGACLAEVDVSPTLDAEMKSATAGGALVFQMVAGKDVTLPMSFKGFKAASDAMAKAGN